MAKKFVAVLLLCIVAIAAVHIQKAEATTEEQFRECYNTCHKECFNDGAGNGYTFCEMKCDADCTAKETKVAIKIRLLLFFAHLLVFAAVTLGVTDPKLKECKHQCKVQQQLDEDQSRACLQQCEKYHQERQQKERQEGGGRGGGSNLWDWDNPTSTDPQKQYRECVKQCHREEEGWPRQQYCQRQCAEKFQEQEREHGRGDQGSINDQYNGREQEEEQQQQQQQEENPYVFEDQHFTTKIQTQHGRVRALPKFTERSKLLKGIENYRLTVLETEPNTFIVPNHWDAEAVFFVASGQGAVSLVHEDKRESFNIRRGDIVRVPSGTTTYLINSDNNNKLVIAKLLQPVSTPGRFESFFGAGGENPESYYRAFSNEILEAAFNTRRDRLQRVFGQQKQGIIIKASEDQIKAMSRHEEAQIWPFRGESKSTFNIFEKRPSQSNQYGQLYEVDSGEYRRLQDLDVAISLANISKGGMTAPAYSSRSTKISVVLNGEGYFEMACPHLSSESQGRQGSRGSQQEWGSSGSQSQGRQGIEQEWGGSGSSQRGERRGGPSYQKVSARLRRGTVVIVPAGHPFVAVASKNQNLEIVCFEINANRNEKFPLAGKRNVFNQLEREAKELAFGVSAREVEEVFNSQQEEYFFKGPRPQQQREDEDA